MKSETQFSRKKQWILRVFEPFMRYNMNSGITSIMLLINIYFVVSEVYLKIVQYGANCLKVACFDFEDWRLQMANSFEIRLFSNRYIIGNELSALVVVIALYYAKCDCFLYLSYPSIGSRYKHQSIRVAFHSRSIRDSSLRNIQNRSSMQSLSMQSVYSI